MKKIAFGIILALSVALAQTSLAATQTLYGIDNQTNNLLRIDPTNASTSIVATLANGNYTSMTALNNQLVLTSRGSHELLTIDPLDGSISSRVDIPPTLDINGLASIGSLLYGLHSGTRELLTIDLTTGDLNVIGDIGFLNVRSLAAIGDTLYGIDFMDQLISIDPETAASMAIGPTGTVNVQSMSAIGDMLFAIDVFDDGLFAIDPATGAATTVGVVPFQVVNGLATIEISQVPIPAAVWLFGSGLIVFARRRIK